MAEPAPEHVAPMSAADFAAALDPEYRSAAAAAPATPVDWAADPPDALRRAYRADKAALVGDAPGDVAVAPWAGSDGRDLGLVFRPSRPRGEGAALYLHGGGWIVGAPETHRVPCAILAARAARPVFAARYRLAPEHPHPAQVEDAAAALAALAAEGPAGPLFLVGDSAGAALAFWTFAALGDALRARIAGIVAFYGAYGLQESASLRRFGAAAPDAGPETLRRCRAALAPAGAPQPMAILGADIAWPPVHLCAAGLDPLRDDSVALAEALRRRGLPVDFDEAPALPHGFLHLAGRVRAARDPLHAAADRLRRADPSAASPRRAAQTA